MSVDPDFLEREFVPILHEDGGENAQYGPNEDNPRKKQGNDALYNGFTADTLHVFPAPLVWFRPLYCSIGIRGIQGGK